MEPSFSRQLFFACYWTRTERFPGRQKHPDPIQLLFEPPAFDTSGSQCPAESYIVTAKALQVLGWLTLTFWCWRRMPIGLTLCYNLL